MNKRDLKKFQENYRELQGDFGVNAGNAIPAEGLRLAVHFDDKDEVKGWGAKWNVNEKYWWLPRSAVTEGKLHEINQRKMANGFIGTMDNGLAAAWVGAAGATDVYELIRDDTRGIFRVYADQGVASWHPMSGDPSAPTAKSWHHLEGARSFWDALMELGFRRIKESPVSC